MESKYEEIMKTKPYLPFDLGGSLTEAMIVKAEEELGETEEVKAKTIPELRQLVQAERDLICPTDDAYLLMFLRAQKFSVEKAFSQLKNYYRVKKSNEDLWSSFNQGALKRALALNVGYVLPYRDEEGCAIAVVKLRKWDVDVTPPSEGIICLNFAALMCVQEPATQVCGVRFLIDSKGVGWKQIRSLIPRYVILIAKAFTNIMPIRLKGFHIYNESPIYMYFISIFKLFLTEKIRQRIYAHGDNQKDLHKYITKAILTEDFGGDNPDYVTELFNIELQKFYENNIYMRTHGYKQ